MNYKNLFIGAGLSLLFMLAGCSSIIMDSDSYTLREDAIIEYYQFQNKEFIEADGLFGYSLRIFEDGLFYVITLTHPESFSPKPYEEFLVTRAFLTQNEMEAFVRELTLNEFWELPEIIPDNVRTHLECEEYAMSVRIGVRYDESMPMRRLAAYMGCPSDLYDNRFNQLNDFMATQLSFLRLRETIMPGQRRARAEEPEPEPEIVPDIPVDEIPDEELPVTEEDADKTELPDEAEGEGEDTEEDSDTEGEEEQEEEDKEDDEEEDDDEDDNKEEEESEEEETEEDP
ncbi:MAG: hypothetical protein LAT67_10575 [Balneolales bacterium]|nr:hypothetical protein [Balneolales bacterium]